MKIQNQIEHALKCCVTNGKFALLLFSIIFLVSCKGNPDEILKSKLLDFDRANKSKIEKIIEIKITEQFPDSNRSPEDVGNTYKVTATVLLKDNTTKEVRYKVFIADKDGWSKIFTGNGIDI